MQQNYLSHHRTTRLIIRPLTMADAKVWEAFFTGNEGLEFVDLFPEKTVAEKASFWLEWQLKRYRENRYGLLALVDQETQQLVGMSGLLTQEVNGQAELEIGYHVLPQYWGKGFATEAAQFFKAYAIKHALSNSIVSIIHEANFRSQKVAEKNGMQQGPKIQFHNQPVYIYRVALR